MTINCRGQLIDCSEPRVMGILNLTPDSFFDGGKYKDEHSILTQVETMIQQGADFIDVGGYSSRPGADDVASSEELNRVVPAIEAISKRFPECLISIDTFRSEVADRAIASGACMINDISGGDRDPNMPKVAAKHQVPYIFMHMRGTPQTMNQLTQYENVVLEVTQELAKKLKQLRALGLNDLIADPGFGFAKTLEQNYTLLNHLEHLKLLEVPILVGLSRKSMIYRLLETQPDHALNGTSVANTIALIKGANILRVHDVLQATEAIRLIKALKN
ncbi:MAG: dihydropteroate synthase [Flavobacteriaceae bacterium]|jgi:dihydropteroate synthase